MKGSANRILVIGGNGFIGKNVVNSLMQHGLYVGSYDFLQNEEASKSYTGNIKDDNNFNQIVSKFDTVIYLITTVSPKKSMDAPELTYTEDIPILLKTLDACLKCGIKKVIFSSSGGTIYGDSFGRRSSETDANEPINHYAVGKLACEKILEMYNKIYYMENISLRIANPFGIGQNPESGVGLITTVIDRIQKNRAITLYGDGSIVRDFVDVKDVAEAFYLAVVWKNTKSISPVFNIGSGVEISLKAIILIVSKILGKEPNIDYLPCREFDVHYNVLDINKAIKELGYSPKSDIEKNIFEYIAHLQSADMKNGI